MAVAYDTAVDANEYGGDGVLSVSVTATGSDRAAFIGSANVHSSSPSIGGSVSYGGTAATELWDYECDSNGDDNRNRTAVYSFVAPPTTSTTVTNTLTSAPAYYHFVGVITLTMQTVGRADVSKVREKTPRKRLFRLVLELGLFDGYLWYRYLTDNPFELPHLGPEAIIWAPVMLLFDGNGPDAGIVVLSYYVAGQPTAPEGFAGPALTRPSVKFVAPRSYG